MQVRERCCDEEIDSSYPDEERDHEPQDPSVV